MIERDRLLSEFFTAFYDDAVLCGPTEFERPITISARTVRALAETFGHDFLAHCLRTWQTEGSVVVLGSMDSLATDAPCIQLLDYVSVVATHQPPHRPNQPLE